MKGAPRDESLEAGPSGPTSLEAATPIKQPDGLPPRMSLGWDRGISREVEGGERVGPKAHSRTSSPRERRLTQRSREMAGPEAATGGLLSGSPRRPLASIVAWWVSASLLWFAPQHRPDARADELPLGGWRTLRVAVLPVRYLGREGADLFDERPCVRPAKAMAGRWQRALEATLIARDQLQVVRTSQVRELISHRRDYRRTTELAARFSELGVTRYNDLQAADALADFDRARALYLEVFADIADPDLVADATLYRGLIYTEQGEVGEAHIAFRDTLMLAPARRFEPGYYPEAVERALTGAQTDLAAQPNKLANRFPIERLAALADLLKVEILVAALLDGPAESPTLQLAIFDQRAQAITANDRIPLGSPELARDLLERRVSAWSTCAVEVDKSERFLPPARKRWFVDLGYIHGVWLTHRRTRKPIQSLGGAIAVTFEPTHRFQLYARVMQLATLPSTNGDLLDPFITTRLALGVGLVFGTKPLRLFVRAGPDLGLSTNSIRMTTDVDCKYFGASHPRCGTITTNKAPAVWFGAEFSLGARIDISRGWYVTFSSGMSSYVLDSKLTGDLNFPWYGSVGFGAPF